MPNFCSQGLREQLSQAAHRAEATKRIFSGILQGFLAIRRRFGGDYLAEIAPACPRGSWFPAQPPAPLRLSEELALPTKAGERKTRKLSAINIKDLGGLTNGEADVIAPSVGGEELEKKKIIEKKS